MSTPASSGSSPPSGGLRIETLWLHSSGNFPNNPLLPVILYRNGFPPVTAEELEESFRALFEANGWSGCWRGGIHDFHHYHSNTHEVMGVCAGQARLELGGPAGQSWEAKPGDVILLPAGTVHRQASATADFAVLAAYPEGKKWDLCRGSADELAEARRQIAQVPVPNDPVFDEGGPVSAHWKNTVYEAPKDPATPPASGPDSNR